jgi:membrane protein YqaA with SNARE-associated domain
MTSTLTSLVGLFSAAFVAATILPMQSEALLAVLINAGEINIFWLVATASLGNIFGSIINWWLGRKIETLKHRSWFPFNPQQLKSYEHIYHRFGYWSLLFSWAPFIGDPLTVLAGVFKEPLWRFCLLVAIAKTGRYIIIAKITLQLVT